MRLLLPCALALTAVLTSACSDDGGDSDEPSADASATALTGTDEAALREVVQAYSDAFLTGDGATAHALLTDRCQEALPAEGFIPVVEEAGELYGSALDFTSFEAKIDGTQAFVTYTYDDAKLNVDQEPWVVEGDSWRQDDC